MKLVSDFMQFVFLSDAFTCFLRFIVLLTFLNNDATCFSNPSKLIYFTKCFMAPLDQLNSKKSI